MSFRMPSFRVGQPVAYHALTVVPLYAEASTPAEYQLSDEAIQASAVMVQEVSEAGSVPELLVENSGDTRVLFLEGEELRGAKQNRILNTSILVAPHTKTKVPVTCVEQGRWTGRISIGTSLKVKYLPAWTSRFSVSPFRITSSASAKRSGPVAGSTP